MSVFWQKDILYLNSDFKCHIIYLTIFESIPQISTIQLVRFYLQLLIRTAGKVPRSVKFLEAKIFPETILSESPKRNLTERFSLSYLNKTVCTVLQLTSFIFVTSFVLINHWSAYSRIIIVWIKSHWYRW